MVTWNDLQCVCVAFLGHTRLLVNKTYTILMISMYAFLLVIDLLVQSSANEIILLSHLKESHKPKMVIAVSLLSFLLFSVHDIVCQMLKSYLRLMQKYLD